MFIFWFCEFSLLGVKVRDIDTVRVIFIALQAVKDTTACSNSDRWRIHGKFSIRIKMFLHMACIEKKSDSLIQYSIVSKRKKN